MTALDAAVQMRWAMLEPYVKTVLSIAARETGETKESVAARLGRPLDNTRTVRMRDGVAIVPVMGPIFPRANLFTEVSGATSIETLARDFTAALENPSVKSILIEIDSPGGSVNGINEFAEMIHAARGRKPIASYVGALCASAAYWIASATDEIVIDDTAGVGSIGVVAIVPDPSKKTAKELEIVSSQSPKKRLDVSTETGRAHIQNEVDQLATIFVDRVARNRGMSGDQVMRAEGAVLIASDAIPAGLADRKGSLEALIAELAQPSNYTATRLAARQEKDYMAEQGIITRIATALGLSSAAKPEASEANAEEVAAAVEAQHEEIKRLKAELATRDQARVETEKKAGEEREARITAEVEAAVAQYMGDQGKETAETFAALLREVKAIDGARPIENGLLAFVASLPPAAKTARTDPATVDTEAVADSVNVVINPDVVLDAKVEARAKADGVSYDIALARVKADARRANA